jgi:hypothetical protein
MVSILSSPKLKERGDNNNKKLMMRLHHLLALIESSFGLEAQ